MELSNAIDDIDEVCSELSVRNPELDELVRFAVRRLINEPFEVLAKGLNPSRFDAWSKGARSKVARQFGSSSDLLAEVLRRGITPDRGDLVGTLATAASVVEAGEPYDVVTRAFAGAFYDNVARDDGFRVQMMAWMAAPNRDAIKADLNLLYDSIQQRIVIGIIAILEVSGRRIKPGVTVDGQAAMLLAATEGAVIQGMIRGHDLGRDRYVDYVVFLMTNGTEPID